MYALGVSLVVFVCHAHATGWVLGTLLERGLEESKKTRAWMRCENPHEGTHAAYAFEYLRVFLFFWSSEAPSLL